MIRLKDIANEAGVSVMTVSKVMSDAPDISAKTKARIRALASKMGYVPDISAQGLRSRKTRLFGIIISAATNPIYARVVMAMEKRAREIGYDLMFAHSLNDPEREENSVRRFLARRVDGIFISPAYRLEPDAPVYQELLKSGTPTVILGHLAPFCQSFANVETDDLTASGHLTRHLLDLGHRRIVFLAGPQSTPWAQQRLEGHRRALAEAQIPWDDELIFHAGSTIEEGAKVAHQVLKEAPNATAIQAVNDLVAIGVSNVFLDQGLEIPRRLSVVGFGNVLTSEFFRVPLTTVREPKWRQGEAAMDLMWQLLEGGRADSRVLPAELIIRQSTAPVPDGSAFG